MEGECPNNTKAIHTSTITPPELSPQFTTTVAAENIDIVNVPVDLHHFYYTAILKIMKVFHKTCQEILFFLVWISIGVALLDIYYFLYNNV